MSTPTIPVPGGVEGALDTLHPPAPCGTYLDVVHSWIVTVDHKKIGMMYIGYALIFMIVAGIEAMVIRIQLAVPENRFVSPFTYNRMFTMHGTTMIFLVGMPI